MDYEVSARTHQGKVRDNNEDAYFTTAREGMFLVADGMGGHRAGEVAAAICRDTIKDQLLAVKSFDHPEEVIRAAFGTAQDQIVAEAAKAEERKGMGCTAVFLLLRDQRFYCAHVGDSRVYLFRRGEMKQMTRDHSYVEELFIRGLISEEEKANHPYKNQITRYLGSKQKLEVDIISGPVWNNDLFLLCTDGLPDAVEPAKIAEIMGKHDSNPEAIAKELEATALENGARDNVTVAVVRVIAKKTSFFKKLLGW